MLKQVIIFLNLAEETVDTVDMTVVTATAMVATRKATSGEEVGADIEVGEVATEVEGVAAMAVAATVITTMATATEVAVATEVVGADTEVVGGGYGGGGGSYTDNSDGYGGR